jgi:signal transduction histidine kinase
MPRVAAEPGSELESLRTENAALAQLLEIATALSAKRSLPQLVQASVDAAVALSGASSADFQLYDETSDTMRLVAQTGFGVAFLDQFEWARQATGSLCWEVRRRGVSVVIEDVVDSPFFRESPEGLALLGLGIRALLATPVVARSGQFLGVVTTCWQVPRCPEAATQRTLLRLARQVGVLVEQHRAEQDLWREQAALRTAHRRTDEFVSMLGHELRDPLSPLLTSLQLMEMRGGEMFAEERRIIGRQVQHMVRLVDNLVEASRVVLGRAELVQRPQEFQAVVTLALEQVTPLLEECRVQVNLELAPHLTVDADRSRLAQVLVNLLLNAAKHTPPGGSVQLRAERQGNQICIGVRDTGVGARPELQEGAFQESAPAQHASADLGLGLTLVRALVALHGGSIETRSSSREGDNEILVRLPACDVSVAQPRRVSQSPQPSRKPGPRRVLIVEDNRDTAESLASALVLLGYSVEVAHDGPSALTKLQGFSPEIALVDIGLPVMGGYELAQRIRAERHSQVRLLAVTGYGQPHDRQRSAEAGFEAHLVKPVDLALLDGAMQGSVSMPK